jgi:hypothetical protein
MKRRAKIKRKAKRPEGRPPLYGPKYLERVHELCLLGFSDQDIARKLEIGESTLNFWKKRHPEFLACYRDGRERADGKVAKALFRRALGYEHPAVKIFNDNGQPMVVPYTEHYPPDTAAALSWLKNRQPDHWHDRVEVTGANGGPVRVQQLSDAELAAIVTAGRGGGGTAKAS